MGVTLWLDTDQEETVELGGTLPVYAAFAEMARVAGSSWETDYSDLAGVLTQCENQEDADPQWLDAVRTQVSILLRRKGDHLSNLARGVLRQLEGG